MALTSDSPASITASRALSLALGQGGDTPAEPIGAPVITSVVDNGDGTLTILGSNFGSKAQAAPVLVDYVDTAYEYGVENTFSSTQATGVQVDNSAIGRLWATVMSGQLKAGGRLPSQNRIYELFGETASLREPYQYEQNERQDGNRQMYFAAWVKYKQNALHHRMTTDEFTVGTFVPGETVSINDGEFIGEYVCDMNEPNNFVHGFRFDLSSESVPDDSQLYGKTLVGQTSGAYLTFPTQEGWVTPYANNYPFVRQRGPKIARVWDDTSGGGLRSSYAADDAYLVLAQVSTGVDFEMRDVWRFVEIELDLTEDGYWGHFVDRVARADMSGDYSAIGDPASSISLEQFGIEGGITGEQVTSIAEAYFDKSRQRVYLGNEPTFSACTHVELQRPVNWQADTVTVAKHEGALTGSKWLYVVGPKGAVNEQGVAA